MILRIISDIHLESCPKYLISEMAGEEEQILILAGDIYPYPRTLKNIRKDFFEDIANRFRKIIYVPGNHEYYSGDFSKGDGLLREYFSQFDNISYLNADMVEIDGIKILGCTLWSYIDPITDAHLSRHFSDYRAVKNHKGYLNTAQTVYTHQEHKKFISENADESSIVVTHHCPSFRSVHPKFANDAYNPFFYTDMDNLVIEKSPKLWVHGHTHCSFNYKIENTRIICNPKGYFSAYMYTEPENIEFDEFLVYHV